jgi:glycosyltransferase involved in cell wall biosynthesis
MAAFGTEVGANLIHLQYHAFSYGDQRALCQLPFLLRQNLPANRLRLVVTLHELAGPPIPAVPGFLRRVWLIPLCHFSDGVVVLGRHDEARLRRLPFLCRRLAKITPSSIVLNESVPGSSAEPIRARFGIPSDALLVVRFGFLHNWKVSQIQTLLHALLKAIDGGLRVHLLFIGGEEPSEQGQLDELLGRLNLVHHVSRSGYLSEGQTSAALHLADLAVQLYPDGVSEKRTSLQAVLLHGLPVISTRRGPVPPPFRHGENLWLIPLGDTHSLAKALEQLCRDAPLRARLRVGALATAQAFSWDAAAEQLESFYRTLPP